MYGAPPNAPRSERGIRRTRRTRGPSRRDGDYGSLELSYSVCTRVTPTRLLFATRREGPRGTRRFRLYPATTLFTSSTVQTGTRNSSRVARTWWVPGSVPWTAGARRDAARSDEVRPDAAEAKSTASTPRRHPRRIEHRSRRRLIRHCCPSPPTPTPTPTLTLTLNRIRRPHRIRRLPNVVCATIATSDLGTRRLRLKRARICAPA